MVNCEDIGFYPIYGLPGKVIDSLIIFDILVIVFYIGGYEGSYYL